MADIIDEQVKMKTQQAMEQPKTAQGVFELPCGYLSPEGQLYTEINVREITGHEEDLLAAPKMPAAKKMNELISRCTTRLGPLTDKGQISHLVPDLLVGDRVFLMFALRRATLGNEYPFKGKCPNCEQEKLYAIDLSTLEVKKMPEPLKRVYEVTLPQAKKIAHWRPLCGRDEEKMAKFATGMDSLSLSMLMRLLDIDGRPVQMDDVKGLHMADRNFLRDEFEDREGGMNTTIDMECPLCGHAFERDVDVSQSGFFFPSAARKNSKRKSST